MRPVLPAALLASAVAAGCASDPHGYRSLSIEESVAVMRAQRTEAGSVSAECVVHVTDGDGRRATLDGATVATPDAFRLQAWRGRRTILDLVVRTDGVWVDGEAAGDLEAATGARLPSSLATTIWQALTGFAPAAGTGTWSARSAAELAWRDAAAAGATTVTVDRSWLRVKRWSVDLPAGEAVDIRIDDHRDVGEGRVVAHRLDIRTPGERIDLRLRDVMLDEPIDPSAFTPPRRSVRLVE